MELGVTRARCKVLAIASGGGHWTQLMRLRPAFSQCDVAFVSVREIYREQAGPARFYCVHDINRLNKWALVLAIIELLRIIALERPNVIVTTGSAPGMLALRIGKWFGARTVWIDSIANIDELSLSGRKARRHADLWLTQWQHLAQEDGPYYEGSIL